MIGTRCKYRSRVLAYWMCNRPETAAQSSPIRRSWSTAVPVAVALGVGVASALAAAAVPDIRNYSFAGSCFPDGLRWRTFLAAAVEVESVLAASACAALAAAA